MREPSSFRETDRSRIKRIVAAIDLSEYSKVVMEKVFVLANAFEADVYLVGVVKLMSLAAEEGDISMSEIQKEERELSDHHQMLIDKYFTGSNLLVESKVLHGNPADKICEFAESVGADLIIIGNRGISGIKRALLGSVSEQVMHKSKVSVLVVKDQH